jgi:hypothetical protein
MCQRKLDKFYHKIGPQKSKFIDGIIILKTKNHKSDSFTSTIIFP